MARYKIAHDLDRTWLSRTDNGFIWAKYEDATLFKNYKQAKAALDTMPVETRSYGCPYKPTFMKFYDSKEHFNKEQEYLRNKRKLRSFVY